MYSGTPLPHVSLSQMTASHHTSSGGIFTQCFAVYTVHTLEDDVFWMMSSPHPPGRTARPLSLSGIILHPLQATTNISKILPTTLSSSSLVGGRESSVIWYPCNAQSVSSYCTGSQRQSAVCSVSATWPFPNPNKPH